MRRWVLGSSLSLVVLMLAVLLATPHLRSTLNLNGSVVASSSAFRGFSTNRAFTNWTTSSSPWVRPFRLVQQEQQSGLGHVSVAPHSTLSSMPHQQTKSVSTASMASENETPASAATDISKDAASSAPQLPKLSAEEFRVYNRLAVMMDAYHNHFRHIWNSLYKACTTGKRPGGVSIRGFISQGLNFCHSLTTHHTIEERYVFPELAERMPIFREQDHLISQHAQIHVGIEKLEEYLGACQSGERELRLPELKEIMDSFGEVLWSHLDDEVRTLGAENMRKYWSKEEILRMQW